MSDTPAESTPAVDLTELRLMPQWVADFGRQQPVRTYSDADTDERPRRPGDRDRGRGGDRPPGRGAGGGGGQRDFRPGGPSGGGGRPPQGDRRREGGRGDARGRGGSRDPRDRDREHAPRQEAPPPQLKGLSIVIEPDNRAVEAMTQMIRTAGKAFSVFDAAKLVLTSNDRFAVKFTLAPDAGAKLLSIPTDGSLWLTRDEAVAHLLQSEVLQQFYKTEEIELEEPKGIFTSVAICGTSGEMLGPPNHHSYQTTLHKLHRERFSNIPFEDYKRRVRTDSTPEAVEKWKESQKHGTQWVDLKAEVAEGGEAPRFKTRTEMETHFRTHHAPSLIGEATEATVAGNIPRKHLSAGLFNALRHTVEEARKHLLPLAQRLCSSFEHHGLKLFKRRGGKLWVSRTRPRLLDSHITLSDRIAKMVTLIKDKPGIPVKDLLSILVPNVAPSKAAPVPAAKTPIAMESPKAESGAEAAAPVDATSAVESVTEVSTPPPAPAEPAAAVAEPPDERLQALKDLHWLNSEGYIIEYSDGVVFPGVTEPPPAKPKAVKEPAPAATLKVEAAPPAVEAPLPVAEAKADAAPVAESIAEEVIAPEASPVEPAEETSEAPAEDFMIEQEDEAPESTPSATTEEKPPVPPDHSRHVD